MPSTPPRRSRPTVATTNSPDRRLTPAASSCASSFSPKPWAVAKRSPKDDTLSGIQPEPAFPTADAVCCGTGRPIAAIRAAMSRSALTRAAVPNRSHPRAKAASATSATTTASIAWLEKKVSTAASIVYRSFDSSAKSSGSMFTPRSWSFSMNLGRRPVDLRRPRKRPSSSRPAE